MDSTRAQIILSLKAEGQGQLLELARNADTLARRFREVDNVAGSRNLRDLSETFRESRRNLEEASQAGRQHRETIEKLGSSYRNLSQIVGQAVGLFGGLSVLSYLHQSMELWKRYEQTVTGTAIRIGNVTRGTANWNQSLYKTDYQARTLGKRYGYGMLEEAMAQDIYARQAGIDPTKGHSFGAINLFARATNTPLEALAAQTGQFQFMVGREKEDSGKLLGMISAIAKNTGMAAKLPEFMSSTMGLTAALRSQNPYAQPETALILQNILGNNPAWRGEKGAQAIAGMSQSVSAGWIGNPRVQNFMIRQGIGMEEAIKGFGDINNFKKLAGGFKKEFAGNYLQNAIGIFGFNQNALAFVDMLKSYEKTGKISEKSLEKLGVKEKSAAEQMKSAIDGSGLMARLQVIADSENLQLDLGRKLVGIETEAKGAILNIVKCLTSSDFKGALKAMNEMPGWMKIAGILMAGNMAGSPLGALGNLLSKISPMLGLGAGAAINPVLAILASLVGGTAAGVAIGSIDMGGGKNLRNALGDDLYNTYFKDIQGGSPENINIKSPEEIQLINKKRWGKLSPEEERKLKIYEIIRKKHHINSGVYNALGSINNLNYINESYAPPNFIQNAGRDKAELKDLKNPFKGAFIEAAQRLQIQFPQSKILLVSTTRGKHQSKEHSEGYAADIVITGISKQQSEEAAKIIKVNPYLRVLNEYIKGSKYKTGDHLHIYMPLQNKNISPVSKQRKQTSDAPYININVYYTGTARVDSLKKTITKHITAALSEAEKRTQDSYYHDIHPYERLA